ncbi:MAG: hypothetical protein ACMXYC_03470 [Candidatus Woesearchaeota archaeon]
MYKWLIILLLCLSVVYATNTPFTPYRAWHHTEDSFTVDGHNFQVLQQGSQGNERIFIRINTDVMLSFSEGDCRVHKHFDICVQKIEHEFKYRSDEWAKIHPVLGVIPGIYITVTDRSPHVVISRSINTSQLYVGELARVEFVVENKGKTAAEYVVIEDVVPSGLHIVRTRGGNAIQHTQQKATISYMRLAPGDKHTVSYEVRAVQQTQANFAALLTYRYDGQIIEDKTRSISLAVQHPVTMSVRPAQVKANEPFTYIVTLENRHASQKAQDILLTVQLPGQVMIRDLKDFSVARRIVSQEVTLQPREKKEISLILQTPDNVVLQNEIKYTMQDIPYAHVVSHSLRAQEQKFSSTLTIDTRFFGTAFLAGTQGQFNVLIKNNDPVDYKDVEIVVTSPFFEQRRFTVGTLAQHEEFNEQFFFTYPHVNQTTRATTTVEFKSNTLDIGRIDKKKDTVVSVLPLEDAIKVTRSFDPRQPMADTPTTMKIELQSMIDRHTITGIFVEELIEQIEKVGNERTSNTIFLSPREKKMAYSYPIRLPSGAQDLQPNVSTRVLVHDQEFIYNGSIQFRAPRAPDIQVTANTPRTLQTGQTHTFNVVIRNRGAYDAVEVAFDPPLAQGIELLSHSPYTWDSIEAGEQVTFSVLYRPIATEQWPDFVIRYRDIDGFTYSESVSLGDLSVTERNVEPPLVVIEPVIVAIEDEHVIVEYRFHNFGNAPTTLQVSSSAFDKQISLGVREFKTHRYTTTLKDDSIFLPVIQYQYTVAGQLAKSILPAQYMLVQEQVEDIYSEDVAAIEPIVQERTSLFTRFSDDLAIIIAFITVVIGSLLFMVARSMRRYESE